MDHPYALSDLKGWILQVFSMVPDWLYESGVSDRSIRLYCVLAKYGTYDAAAGEYHRIRPAVDTIAGKMGVHRATIFRLIKELEGAGALIRAARWAGSGSEGGRASNSYRLRVGLPPMILAGDQNVPVTLSEQDIRTDATESQDCDSMGLTNATQPPLDLAVESHQLDGIQTHNPPQSSTGRVSQDPNLSGADALVGQTGRTEATADTLHNPLVGADLEEPAAERPARAPGVDQAEPPTREDPLSPRFVGVRKAIFDGLALFRADVTDEEVRAVHRRALKLPHVQRLDKAIPQLIRKGVLVAILDRLRTEQRQALQPAELPPLDPDDPVNVALFAWRDARPATLPRPDWATVGLVRRQIEAMIAGGAPDHQLFRRCRLAGQKDQDLSTSLREAGATA